MAVTGPAPGAAAWSSAVTDSNHGPLISIAVSLMLVGMFMFLACRLYIRWPWRQLIGRDDWAVVVGSALALGQSIAIFQAIRHGLGRRSDEHSLDMSKTSLEESILASDILSIMALTGSKLAVSLLILRLSAFRQHVIAARTVTAAIVIWGVVSTVGTGITRSNFNLGPKAGWISIGATSFALEVALFILPIFLVWNLQMKLSSKITVVVGFAFRIPASILALFRVLTVLRILKGTHGDNPRDTTIDVFWEYTTPTIYTTIEMHYSLMAATIPCMHLFLKNFYTGYLRTTADQIDPSTTNLSMKASGFGQSDSYALGSVRGRYLEATEKKKKRRDRDSDVEDGRRTLSQFFRGDVDVMTTSSIVHPDHTTEVGSVDDGGSDKIVVRQTVDVKFDEK